MGALAGFDSDPMGALAGFELPTAASGKRDDGLASIPLSSLDAPPQRAFPAIRGLAVRRIRADGRFGWFWNATAARMYFATVSRSMSNSRAIRRCRQPRSCNPKIA